MTSAPLPAREGPGVGDSRKILAAVLAGGASSRFGSDKALALHNGQPLIAHVISALVPQADALVVCGRPWPGYASVADLPTSGLGPLGGLCAALDHAVTHGFDAVLCAPCDTLGLPTDLADRLSPGPAVAAGQRVIGMWPSHLAPTLRGHLETSADRSLRVWMALTGACEVDCGSFTNINYPGDFTPS